jgi:hypothetical protein
MVVLPIDKEPLDRGRVVTEWGFFLSPRSVYLAPISHPRPVRLLGAFYWSLSLSISTRPDILRFTYCMRETGNPLVVNAACRRYRLRCGAGLSGLSPRSLSEDGSAASANDMVILVRLDFEQLC